MSRKITGEFIRRKKREETGDFVSAGTPRDKPPGTNPLKSKFTSHVKLVALFSASICSGTPTRPCLLMLILVNPFLLGTSG